MPWPMPMPTKWSETASCREFRGVALTSHHGEVVDGRDINEDAHEEIRRAET